MFTHHLTHRLAGCSTRPIAALAVLALLAPASALADSNWSTVGSTGTADESCIGGAQVNRETLLLLPGATAASCTVRYQVQDTLGGTTGARRSISAGFVDNGDYARVQVRLYRLRISNGSVAGVSTLTSNDYPRSTGYQRRTDATCVAFDFETFSYFVEVELNRLAAPSGALIGRPEIRYVGLAPCN